jgi:Secretion system C-terminal sorting domain
MERSSTGEIEMRYRIVGIVLMILLVSMQAMAWEIMPGKAGVMAFAASADEQRLIAGVYRAGIWYSNDAGLTWSPSEVPENRPYSIISIEAVDSNADTLQLRCNFSSYPTHNYPSKQNMISTDGGQSWYYPHTTGHGTVDKYLIIDPEDHNNFYFMENQDFNKSSDFGNTWGPDVMTCPWGNEKFEFILTEDENHTLFSSTSYTGAYYSGVLRSNDDGDTWEYLLDPTLYYQDYVGLYDAVLLPDIDKFSNGDLFATAYWSSVNPHVDSFLRSVDDGLTWTEEYPLHTAFDPYKVMEYRDDPGHLLLLGGYDGSAYWHKIYESFDYGHTFQPLEQPYSDYFRNSRNFYNNRFNEYEYVCTKANGTWKSENNGESWEELPSPPFSSSRWHNIQPDFISYAARGDEHVYLQRNADLEVLELNYPSPPADSAHASYPIAAIHGDTLIGMYSRQSYETEQGVMYTVESYDLGETWSDPIGSAPLSQTWKYWRVIYAEDDGENYIMYVHVAGDYAELHMFDDHGAYLGAYDIDYPRVKADVRDGYLYVVESLHDVKRCELGTDEWEYLNHPAAGSIMYGASVIDDDIENIYTFDGVFGYKYENGVWHQLGVLPTVRVHSATAIPRDGVEPIFIVTAQFGPEVYISLDGGYEWDPIEQTVPWHDYLAQLEEVIYDPHRNRVWVETPVGFMWEDAALFTGVEETDPQVPTTHELLSVYPNPFNSQATVTIRLDQPHDVTLTLFNTLGQEVRTLVDERMVAGEHAVAIETDGLASGTYFVRLMTVDGLAATRKIELVR